MTKRSLYLLLPVRTLYTFPETWVHTCAANCMGDSQVEAQHRTRSKLQPDKLQIAGACLGSCEGHHQPPYSSHYPLLSHLCIDPVIGSFEAPQQPARKTNLGRHGIILPSILLLVGQSSSICDAGLPIPKDESMLFSSHRGGRGAILDRKAEKEEWESSLPKELPINLQPPASSCPRQSWSR